MTAPVESSEAPPADGLLDEPVAPLVVTKPMARNLARLGIGSVRDLLFHLPRRYDDFSHPMTLRELRDKPPEGPVSATVEIVDLRVEQGFRRRVQRTVARLKDETGEGEAVWFGRRYIERRLAAGQDVALSGKVELRGWLPSFKNPEFGPAGDDALHAGRIVPVYRLTAGVLGPTLRTKIRAALDIALPALTDYLPPDVRREAGDNLPEIREAVEAVHFPPDFAERDRALRRLAFDELFALQLGMVARQRQRRTEEAITIAITDEQLATGIAAVERVIGEQVARRRALAGDSRAGDDEGVRLSIDQARAVDDIRADLSSGRPMMRLLQGDVGSGKTAVAALALAFAADAGHQGALLAPTDLLARQHAQTLGRLLEPLGHDVTLLTGSLNAATRREVLDLLGAPLERTLDGLTRGRIVVGTHALVQEAVAFQDLRLAVVDEQHRFGVAEREALTSKGGAPHVLLMTATPIPRTLGQIVHADLDVSDLRTPPAGRQEIGTAIRATSELIRRGDGNPGALPLIVREVAAGHRAFVVVPLVEEDPEAGARSVEQGAEMLRKGWAEANEVAGLEIELPGIEIVHGQMKASERDERMERFRTGEAQIVVGTTVLEVGVDVPEATVMLILDADRFGLAQLHQLRGRVGRGEARSFCVLVTDRYPARGDEPDIEQATVKARLDALAATHDGFELAEMDLEQRREGELLGVTQSGLPPLRVASLDRADDRAMSQRARVLAEQLLDDRGRLPASSAALEREITVGWLRRIGAGEVVAAGSDA
ncbi:MAG TPA: ATP-dependent DNA helicase RecG [Candidatus Limnocylindrales bacterium]|nr:ATP-dependent DNA helicase RecG [Candidatus Limnocylindrales bacterium]